MRELRSTNDDETGISPVVHSHSPVGSADVAQLSTVHEVDSGKLSDESKVHQTSPITGFPPKLHRPQSGPSRDASPSSTLERVYDEKLAEQAPRRLRHKPQSIRLREQQNPSKDLTPLRDGTDRDSMADDYPEQIIPKKAKSRGLRTMIRRLFSKKTAKNRISMPAPVTTSRNVSLNSNRRHPSLS